MAELYSSSRPPVVATYSIAACDLDAGHWGVATQSKFLAVGSVVPWAEPQVGAIATQAYANPRYGRDGLALLREGLAAAEVVERLTDADDDRAQRQLGVVDARGGSATFTGAECMDWAGGHRRAVLRRAGEHPRRRRDRGGARDDVRGDVGPPARRAAARVPRRRAGRGRRPARAAVGGARSSSSVTAATPASATCSSTCASTTTTQPGRRARAPARAARAPLRQVAARDLDRRRRRPAGRAHRPAREARLHGRARAGLQRLVGHREPRGTRRRRRAASIRSCSRSSASGERRRLRDPLDRRPRPLPGRDRTTRRSSCRCAAASASGRSASTAGRRRRPAGVVIERHYERDGDEELYVVVRGHATFTVGEETVDAPAGTLVHLPPGTLREATADDEDTVVLALGAKPGEAWEPAPWEDFHIAFAIRRAGDAARRARGDCRRARPAPRARGRGSTTPPASRRSRVRPTPRSPIFAARSSSARAR